MEHILKNELLYTDGNEVEIYQTYNKNKNTFGLYRQSPEGSKKLVADYVFIHPYEGERTAALNQSGDFVWINTDLNESAMDTLDRVIVEVLKVKNSTCNCMPDGNFMECELCVMGEIFNPYNWKIVKEDVGLTVFEYDTESSTYIIRLSEWDTFINLTVDYIWEQEEVQTRLKGIIDTFEEQNEALEEQLLVCIVIRSQDSPATRLVPCTVSIDKVNATSSLMDDSTVLKFSDFNSQTGKL